MRVPLQPCGGEDNPSPSVLAECQKSGATLPTQVSKHRRTHDQCRRCRETLLGYQKDAEGGHNDVLFKEAWSFIASMSALGRPRQAEAA